MDYKKLAVWLKACGAEVRPVTPPYELYRFRTCDGTITIYQNKHGVVNMSSSSPTDKFMKAFADNRPIRLTPHPKVHRTYEEGKRDRSAKALHTRDGGTCFFCECNLFLDATAPEDGKQYATLEHLIPLSRGGPDTLENLLLACGPCNNEAGNLNIMEKVRLRDRKLSGRTAPAHTQTEKANGPQDPPRSRVTHRSRSSDCDDAGGRPYPLRAEQPDTHPGSDRAYRLEHPRVRLPKPGHSLEE